MSIASGPGEISADATSDYINIMQVLGRFAVEIDSQHADEWTQLFWPDGVFRTPWPPSDEIIEFRGHDRIREIGSAGYHGCHNGGVPVISIDGARAEVTWPFIIITARGDSPFETRVGRYEIELERRDGRWGIGSLLVKGTGAPID